MRTGRIGSSDMGWTALLVVGGLVGTAGAAANHGQAVPVWSYVLTVAACLPVMVSHWRPAWAVTLSGVFTCAYVSLGYAYGPILVALVMTAYRFAIGVPVRWAVRGATALICAILTAVAARAAAGSPQGWSDFVAAAALVAAPVAVGVAVGIRRDAAGDLRREQLRRAASEERLRLAQELHDEVGHGLAVIAMQAGVALRVLDRDQVRVREALEAIRSASRGALDGVRAELAALRLPQSPGSALRPATGLAELSALAARVREGGVPVTLDVDDAVAAAGLSTEVGQAAYRIVQESLTNVLRHGGTGATARVRIEMDAGALHLAIIDTGRGAAPGATGQGLEGMRARAQALGGAVQTGSSPDGGFAVHARLPAVDGAALQRQPDDPGRRGRRPAAGPDGTAHAAGNGGRPGSGVRGGRWA